MDIKSCCFTGHRNVPFEEKERLGKVLSETVRKLVGEGCRDFFSGGAVGFDLMAAEAVLEIKRIYPHIRLVMVLPCRDQHKKWGNADRARYERILEDADEVLYVCREYITGCMHLRNKFMVDRADLCVAYMTRRGGGTEFTVNYAREKGKRLICL